MEGWILRSVTFLRIVQYAAPLPTLAADTVQGGDAGPVVVAGYVVAVVWSAWMFASAHRDPRHRVPPPMALVDVLLICGIQIATAVAIGSAWTTWQNWTYGPAIGAAIVAVLYRPRPSGWLLAGVVAAMYALVPLTLSAFRSTPLNVADLVSGTGGVIAFTALAGYGARVLRQLAYNVDEARAAEAAAIASESALRARFEERTRQLRGLHDTALATLEMIAGGLDVHSEQIRARCRSDADYLHGLLAGAGVDGPTNLTTVLAEIIRDRSALGLRVHPQFDDLPAEVPANVAEAIALATREALNNVSKHADVGEAWLTAVGTPDHGIHVTIVDRGLGFDPGATTGTGLTRSIRHRMEEIRGDVFIDSAPGEGTTVELSWTP